MALDVQISVISATLMTDGETTKSINFLRPYASLCFFQRSRRLRCELGKANDDGSEALTRRRISVGKPIPETCAIFARGEGRAPPSPSSSVRAPVQLTVHVIFLTNTSRGHCFCSLLGVTSRSLADSLPSFGKLAAELQVHQNRRCFITLLVVPPL